MLNQLSKAINLLLLLLQQAMAMNATSVVPNIVAVDGLSPATSELTLFNVAQCVGPVQVAELTLFSLRLNFVTL